MGGRTAVAEPLRARSACCHVAHQSLVGLKADLQTVDVVHAHQHDAGVTLHDLSGLVARIRQRLLVRVQDIGRGDRQGERIESREAGGALAITAEADPDPRRMANSDPIRTPSSTNSISSSNPNVSQYQSRLRSTSRTGSFT